MKRIELDKDIKPLSEFCANAPSFLNQIRMTKRPLVITQHGKSVAVLLDVREYEALIEKLEVLSEIFQAEGDIKRKRIYSSKQVLERFKVKGGK